MQNGEHSRTWTAALGAPPALLATATLFGLGLERGVPGPVALLVAVGLLGLPILGLRALMGAVPGRTAVLSVCWSALALAALPLYFPGERSPAARRGLESLTSPLGEHTATGIAGLGVAIVDRLGPDRRPAPPAVALTTAQPSAPTRPKAATIAPARTAPSPSPRRSSRSVLIPYRRERGSLEIGVDVDGPELGERFTMIFDTGATYTTLSRAALDTLDIHVPGDAPRARLQTAGGEIEAPLVLVDAFWLGDAVVEWVTVAVCDTCATEHSVGLLGLNVSSQFRVDIDHDRSRIELRPGRGVDRKTDIERWLRIEATTTEYWDGGVELSLRARNDAIQPIRSAVAEIECSGGAFGIEVDDVPAGGTAETVVSLPRGTDCRGGRLALSRASWLLDRFD